MLLSNQEQSAQHFDGSVEERRSHRYLSKNKRVQGHRRDIQRRIHGGRRTIALQMRMVEIRLDSEDEFPALLGKTFDTALVQIELIADCRMEYGAVQIALRSDPLHMTKHQIGDVHRVQCFGLALGRQIDALKIMPVHVSAIAHGGIPVDTGIDQMAQRGILKPVSFGEDDSRQRFQ